MFEHDAIIDGPDGAQVCLDDLTDEQLEDLMSATAAQRAALDARLVAIQAAVRRRCSWAQYGMRSPAHWLAWKTGLLQAEASRIDVMAERLPALPALSEAFASGSLSLGQTSVAATVATPDNETELVRQAEGLTAAQLQKVCRTYRRVTKTERQLPADRPSELSLWWDDTGRLRVNGNLDAADGAAISVGIEAMRPEPTAGERPVWRESTAQALVCLAERTGEGAPQRQVIFHCDLNAMEGRASGKAYAQDGSAVSAADLARVLCDSSVVALIERANEPLAIGRARRAPTVAQRRAAAARDGGCRFPGCTNQRFVDLHHVVPWPAGGPTNLDNLLTLCDSHHRFIHKNRWTTQRRNGRIEFVDRFGQVVPARPATGVKAPPTASVEPELARSGWGGEPMTEYAHDMLVSELLRSREPPEP